MSMQGQGKTPDSEAFFGIRHSDINEANLNVFGICWDRSSSYRKGASEAPPMIRAATSGKLYNSFTEQLVDLKDVWTIYDAGDVPSTVQDLDFVHREIQSLCARTPNDGRKYLFLGGDHTITYLCTKALVSGRGERWGLLYLDSHPDLYESYGGDPYSHACVVRRIVDEGIVPSANVLEVGVHAPTPDQLLYARDRNLRLIPVSAIFAGSAESAAADIVDYFSGRVDQIYLSVDLDVLDPAFAPGVGNPEPGGLSTRTVLEILQRISALSIRAFDIVELCPPYDCSGVTAFAASKIIRETLGTLVRSLD